MRSTPTRTSGGLKESQSVLCSGLSAGISTAFNEYQTGSGSSGFTVSPSARTPGGWTNSTPQSAAGKSRRTVGRLHRVDPGDAVSAAYRRWGPGRDHGSVTGGWGKIPGAWDEWLDGVRTYGGGTGTRISAGKRRCQRNFDTLAYHFQPVGLLCFPLMTPRAKRMARNVAGPQVRRLRVALNLSQAELAARCEVMGFDIGRASVSHIENGLRGISDLELALLARALRVPVGDLLPDVLPEWRKDTRPPTARD